MCWILYNTVRNANSERALKNEARRRPRSEENSTVTIDERHKAG